GRGSGGSNCAGAWVAAEPRSTSRAAVLASLTWNSRVLLFMTSPLFFTLVLAIASRDDIKGIDDDPGVRRKRVLAHQLDRQRVARVGQATREEVGVLGPFG